jgi:hypothetical protein
MLDHQAITGFAANRSGYLRDARRTSLRRRKRRMTTRNAVALLAAAWLLAGCASFGEGVTRGLLAKNPP